MTHGATGHGGDLRLPTHAPRGEGAPGRWGVVTAWSLAALICKLTQGTRPPLLSAGHHRPLFPWG